MAQRITEVMNLFSPPTLSYLSGEYLLWRILEQFIKLERTNR